MTTCEVIRHIEIIGEVARRYFMKACEATQCQRHGAALRSKSTLTSFSGRRILFENSALANVRTPHQSRKGEKGFSATTRVFHRQASAAVHAHEESKFRARAFASS